MSAPATFLELPETPTFNVWRVENFLPVPWPDPGAFYTGDSYIVLSAVFAGATKRVVRDIFFWIGAKSSQDEYGAAAILSVQLDDRFGGEPTQHRELQGHESDAFYKLFGEHGGVRYLDGGIASGFKAVDYSQGVSLYQVKGRRNPVLLKVPATGASLNHGDAFILTSDKALFLWIGKGANAAEKAKAAQVQANFAVKFKGAEKIRLEGSETSPAFWALLGGEVPIADAGPAEADSAAEVANVKKIFKQEGAGFVLVAEGAAATLDKLKNPPAPLIVQRGEQIIVVVPKASDAEVKKKAIETAVGFLSAQGLPNWYSVSVAKEGVRDDVIDLVFV